MDKIILKRLAAYLKNYKLRFIQAVFCMIMVALFTTGLIWLLREMVDKVLIAKDMRMLLFIMLSVPLLHLVKGVFIYCQNYLMNYISQAAICDLRQDLYKHLQKLSGGFYHNHSTGHLMSLLTSDVTLLQNSIATAPVQLIRDSFTVLFLMGTIFYLHWKFALFTLILLPIAAGPITVLGRKMRHSSSSMQDKMSDLFASLQESIVGNVITKIYCKEEHEIERFKQRNLRYFSECMRWVRADVLGAPLMEFLGSIGAAALLWFGGRDVINGVWTTGSFFSFLGASISAYRPIKELTGVNARFQQGLACAERIFKLLDQPIEIQEVQNASMLPFLQKEITFKNVSFSYNANLRDAVLKNINVTVKKGEIVALVGASGSGKTTMVQLLPRLFDVTQGEILLDGIDIKTASLKSLRAQIGMVTQETILFNETVSYNLSYGLFEQSSAAHSDLEHAAKAANAHEFIAALPHGYETLIGERGLRLSGGQRQRLSIARAILKNPPILILDEATSALDNESERLVQQALERLMQHRTVFVVAHRLSTVRKADRIFVLNHGEIVEQGKHEELLANSQIYKKLYQTEIHH